MGWVLGAVIGLGVVAPFAIWCVVEHRRLQRERVKRAVADWFGDADLADKPALVLWADPRRH